jgi:hypothetical protein
MKFPLLGSALSRRARDDESFRVRSKPRLGLLQRKGILVVGNVGAHPSSLTHVHDVEAAMTFSVTSLFQTKALVLGDAIDALFLCISHGVAPVEPDGLYDQCGLAGRFSWSVADQTVDLFSLALGIFGEESPKVGRRASRVRPKPNGTTHSARITVSRACDGGVDAIGKRVSPDKSRKSRVQLHHVG